MAYAHFAKRHPTARVSLLAYYFYARGLQWCRHGPTRRIWCIRSRICLNRLFENYPDTPEAAAAAWWLAIGNDDAELDACRALDRCLESIAREGEFHTSVPGFGENARADNLCRVGYLLIKLGRLDEARQAYLRITQEHPTTNLVLHAQYSIAGIDGLRRVRSLIEAGDYEAARVACRETSRATANDAVWRAVGAIESELKGLLDAEAWEG